MKVRALFDFDPAEDELLPCKDVGLRFKKGDILHIVNQEDPDWWQVSSVKWPGSPLGWCEFYSGTLVTY